MKKTILVLLIAGLVLFGLSRLSIGKEKTGTATLSWGSDESGATAGYKVYYGLEKRTDKCPKANYAEVVDAGKGTNFTVENLERGKTYYFSTTSYNKENKESCFSDEVSKKIDSYFVESIKNLFKKNK